MKICLRTKLSGWGALLLLVGTGYAQAVEAPEKRNWTAKSGHKVEATLVKYSDYEITLQLANGTEKAIAVDQFSPEDVAYLKSYPKLLVKAPPAKLPWIRMDAKIAARSRDSVADYHEASKAYEIEISTREKEKKEIEVVYVWVAKRQGAGARGSDTLLYFGLERKKATVPAQSSVKVQTGTGTATLYPGYELAGVIAQVYWDGFLVDSYTSVGIVDKLSKEEKFWEKVTVR